MSDYDTDATERLMRQEIENLNSRISSYQEDKRRLEALVNDVRNKNTELEIAIRKWKEVAVSEGKTDLHPWDICVEAGPDNPLAQNARCVISDLKYRLSRATNRFSSLREANWRRNKEWDPDNKVTGFWRAAEMAGEAGELGEAMLTMLNVFIAVGKVNNTVKKLERERLGIRGSRTDMAALGRELADVIITTDLAAMHYGLDLWAWTRDTFNATSEKQGMATKLE